MCPFVSLSEREIQNFRIAGVQVFEGRMKRHEIERFIWPDARNFRLQTIEQVERWRAGNRSEGIVSGIYRKTRPLHIEDERKDIPGSKSRYLTPVIRLLVKPFEDRHIGIWNFIVAGNPG